MLALSPGRVRDSGSYQPRWKPVKRTGMGNVGRMLGQLLLGMCMDWLAAPDNPHYVGCPAEATAEAGEAMTDFHVREGLALLKTARDGRYCPTKPYPWLVATISKLFE